MASQWRIRHKLMLGLVLVVGAITLLLGGTLRGLWSYYLTMNAIRGKMNELKAAEDFKDAVGTLVEQHNIESIPTAAQVPHALEPSREALERYRQELDDNPNNRFEPDDSTHERELVKILAQNLDSLGEALKYHFSCPTIRANVLSDDDILDPRLRGELIHKLVDGVAQVPLHGSQGLFSAAELAYVLPRATDYVYSVRRNARVLTTNAADLRAAIYDRLDKRLSETRSHYQMALWVIVPASVVGLMLTCGLMRSFYSWVFNPIRDLEAGVRRVAGGDFSQRLEVNSADEMEDLGRAFNDMMQRLQDLYSDLARQVNERSRQLVRSERLASVGFLAAGVAHEINNPLASIAFCSEALEARLTELLRGGRRTDDFEVFAKYLRMIQEEAFRCKNITERLLAFSRTGERRREMTDLGQLTQAVLDVTQHLQNSRGKHIDFAIVPDRAGGARVMAPVNAEEIKSVVLNLIVNALDSMDEGGSLTIRLGQRNGMAEMTFTDTGCGMTQEVLENIFEPFFTKSRTGKGTGLGLTISHRVIHQHGGEIEAASPGPNQGSTFTVRLPLQVMDTPAAAPETRRPVRGLAA
jgi:signal transduction histidine kinase